MASSREIILDTAARLFYHHGFQAVGVDTIVAEAGISKMTLYRHFPSKDDLIVAYLERSDGYFRQWFDEALGRAGAPSDRLIAVFEALERLVTSPTCYGCTFQVTAAEFPDPEHPAHRAAMRHKEAVMERFTELAEAGGLEQPSILAGRLLLLMDGAWTAARMFGPANPAAHVAGAARLLIEGHARTETVS